MLLESNVAKIAACAECEPNLGRGVGEDLRELGYGA